MASWHFYSKQDVILLVIVSTGMSSISIICVAFSYLCSCIGLV